MAGYEVDQVVEVEFLEGRDETSLSPQQGWLGVGHIDGEDGRREIFGEVMYGDKDYRAFTMRCYHLDEHLGLDRMSHDGLVLDAGTSRDRVEVPADQVQKALHELRKPVSLLQPGETVTVLRNSEHPAWKDLVEGEYGTEYVLPDSFEPLVAHEVPITERREDPGRSTGWNDRPAKTTVRAANGFWYGPDGEQDGSSATLIVAERSLDGTALAAWVPDREGQPEHGASIATPAVAGASAASAVAESLSNDVALLRQTVDQWNPHNAKQAPRVRFYRSMADAVEQYQESLGAGHEGFTFEGLGSVRSALDEHLVLLGARSKEQAAPAATPSAEHLGFIAQVKRAPSRFDDVAVSEPEGMSVS